MSKRGTGRLVVALALALLLGAGSAVRAAEPRALVVSSIRPLHLILLALAGDRVDARVLLEPGVSPHDFALRPSQVRLLAEARQVFWIGPTLERPLVTVFERLPPPRRDRALLAPLELPARADGFVDPHAWLDPRLAAQIAAGMAQELETRGLVGRAELEPRLRAFEADMRRVEGSIAAELRGLERVPFVAMHDGYAYFVQRFGLSEAAVLALDAEQQVGARALARMRSAVRDSGAVCLLRENAGDNARLAEMIAEGSGLRVRELDSLAAGAPDDGSGFGGFLEDFARTVAGCLRGPAS
jgi:zinc transport system substrate-binding protein